MRGKPLLASAVLHLAVLGVPLWTHKDRPRHAAIAINLVHTAKLRDAPQAPPKRLDPPPPAPAALVARAEARPRSAPGPAAAAREPGPVETGLTLSNDDGPGVEVGPAQAAVGRATAPEGERLLTHRRGGDADGCDEELVKPVVVARPSEIQYTEHARASSVEGRLVLQVVVGVDGLVAEVKVLQSVEPALDAAAVSAVQSWRFRPATRCGRPVQATYTVAQRFELGD